MSVSQVEVQWNPKLESKPAHQVYRLSLCTSCVDLLDAGLGWTEMPVYSSTGCFTTCGRYCRRWFLRSLW